MPSLQGESAVAGPGSPMRRNRLSLKFFQKKETKRALDFSEPPPPAAVAAAEPEQAKPPEEEESSDQVVPNVPPHPTSPGILPPCEKKDSLVPFVGLNNLGNTCYLNSILQVLYYCPRLREGVKKLHNLCKTEDAEETLPMYIELIGSFNSLISSMEQLLTNFLLNPTTFSEGELATPPRKILHTLRQLNPMYDGYLQHDAQEVLQCILGYMQEACDNIRKQKEPERTPDNDPQSEPKTDVPEDEAQPSGKRKSDTELGNAKKKPKSTKKSESDNKMMTRSKRKSSVDASPEANKEEEEEEDEDDEEKEASKENIEKDGVGEQKRRKKKKAKLGWLRPSGKQPSIFSKFLSVGKITSAVKVKQEEKHDQVTGKKSCPEESADDKKVPKPKDDLDLMEHLFQGQLVLRTRCLECECFTERREDFQDISVPVLDEEPSSPDDLSEVSPDPKPEVKTLNWALGQFASVERLVGEDKYFCETCCHYTEAERSLLFDKTPEVVTIHLKRFSASSSQLDPYGGLSKVNTPLQTPLTLSLDEWCTPTSTTKGHQYQLFAVVMHSGVTISCGHYTAFVRVRNLNDVKLHLKERREAESEEETKEEVTHYDDGEVSLRQRDDSFMKKGTKKTSEGGVGLLGGQRSFSGCDVGHSKLMESAEGSRRRRTFRLGLNSESGVKTEPEEGAVAEKGPTERAGGEATEQEAIKILQEYEGKWLLFDDSEVRLFEEAEFMQACSPDTFSSSTPYLLFYSRTPEVEAGK